MKRIFLYIVILAAIVLLLNTTPQTLAEKPDQPDETSGSTALKITRDGRVSTAGRSFGSMSDYFRSDFFKSEGRRCGTEVKRPLVARQDPLASTSDCTLYKTTIKNEYYPGETYTIPIVFHVIYKSDGTGNIPDSRIINQVKALNEDYAATPGSMGAQGYDSRIRFSLVKITRTQNDNWFDDYNEAIYKAELGWDQDKYLNVYVNSASGYLGYAYLPQDAPDKVLDGVVILYSSVGGRGEGSAPYNYGRTLTHEIGHYLGLLHTFEGYGCYTGYTQGDLIADTNSENTDHYGCTQTSSCGTADPIHNYMNYTDDICMYEFTAEQSNRMICGLVNYRPQLYTTSGGGGGGGGGGGTPTISLNRTALRFGATTGGIATGSQTILVSNSGTGSLNWNASTNQSWLSCSPTSGGDGDTTGVSVSASGLSPGMYTGTVTIGDTNASNSSQTVTVEFYVFPASWDEAPFGEMAEPVNGSTVKGAIPVTGWVLDDIGMSSVKIYANSAYIGDAAFVDGARPDVESTYTDYPFNYMAGWGYMLLTHFLADGSYTISAVGVDVAGKTTTLGSSTVYVDNANAVKPFGAIDTPNQGGTASGSNFVNWGWVLTPQPNSIPTDGSTINVWVDGVNIGNPTYNIYRDDIATFFPGYANSNGAAGYFYLDTTAYDNGVHIIQWTATDTGGNTDGIGSRFFTIQNTGSSRKPAANRTRKFNSEYRRLEPAAPVRFRSGFNPNSKTRLPKTGRNGSLTIETKALGRVELHLPGSSGWTAFLLTGDGTPRSLPAGSTFDRDRGILYWSLGAGYRGDYQFAFVNKRRGLVRNVTVRVLPGVGRMD